MTAREPDFFIVGAPKAGTTALARYLGEHPAIYLSNPKETFFHCTDFQGVERPESEEAFQDLFRKLPPGTLRVGEATAMNLYSREAIPAIRRRSPEARLLVALRSPVDLAVSFHAQQLYGLSEDEPDFVKAWNLQGARAQGQSLPPLVREPLFLQYARVAMLGEQVERALQVFPREQVHFVVFDALASDTAAVYRAALSFLDVPDDGRVEFPVVNERKQSRSSLLGRVLQRPPKILSKSARAFKKVIGQSEMAFLDGLRRANAEPAKKTVLEPGFRRDLVETFRDDVERLQELTGLNLAHWVSGADPREA